MKKRIQQTRKLLSFTLGPIKRQLLNRDFRKRTTYTKYIHNKRINDQMIFYESYHGQSMTGNPYAIFKYILHDPAFRQYTHVWAIEDESVIPQHYKNYINVIFVPYQSIEYAKYLATAKYLINDTTFPYYFQKRKEQIYINTWHGTPLKTMGLDIKQRGYTDHKNIQRNLLHANYFINPNRFTAEKMLKSHDIHTIYNGEVLDIGYPRVDLMIHANREKVRKKLNIPNDKKVILYAPTWRGISGEEKDESERLLQTVETIQEKIGDDYIVLLKAHYYAEEHFNALGRQDLCISHMYDTNEILSIVDILITDYSSIFFEFLSTKRPILFYTYDAEEYQHVRGTYIPLDQLPGPLCETTDEVIHHLNDLNNITERNETTYNEFLQEYCYHDDGQATKRLVDTIFHQQPSAHIIPTGTDKTKILMYGGGFLNNGITSSVVSLLNGIDYDQYDVTLIDHGNNVKEEKWQNVKKINDNVHHIFRVGTWNASIADLYRHHVILRFGLQHTMLKRLLPKHMYTHEMNRLIGLSKFDIGIDFSGYSPFWASLIAFGDFKKRSIYLHSDMSEEVVKKVNGKYPHRRNLNVVFHLYNFFDKVFSVSKLTHEKNKHHLKNAVHNYKKKMDYVINAIDYERILSLKNDHTQQPLHRNQLAVEFAEELAIPKHESMPTTPNLFPWPRSSDINFINIGRLGPEKDHAKLINAFHRMVAKHPHIKLYIVGEGALEDHLKHQVKILNLQKHVIFTGQISNPYALLDACDCFVLSSNHEGQPIVLLEALILRKPVIVTNIPGARSVIDGGYGLVVDNSVEGLVEGMNTFLNDEDIFTQTFDYEAYAQEAINMFYQKVCHIDE